MFSQAIGLLFHSPCDRQIVSGSRDKTIKLWNTLGECKYTIQEDVSVGVMVWRAGLIEWVEYSTWLSLHVWCYARMVLPIITRLREKQYIEIFVS